MCVKGRLTGRPDDVIKMARKSKDGSNIPLHIAIIPDGNRRWARTNRLNLVKGYSAGINKIIDVCIWAQKQGVKTVSVWALSSENVKERSRGELSLLYRLYTRAAYDSGILKLLQENRAHVRIIGNLSLLPARLREALKRVERKTKMYKDLSINLLVSYGGRDDIEYAVKSVAARGARADAESIRSNLMTADVPDVDLIIRTSGERRLSGFLPWQSNYSELYFARKNWPDFGKGDLKRAIEAFKRRQRRFGG